MNKLVFNYQPFVLNQKGYVIYQDDETPTCEIEFRMNQTDKFKQIIEDYNIAEIEVHNSKMAKPFTEWVKKNEPSLNFTLKD